ncbi:hypothetical protein GCM10023194_23160 [Planotetraspora phitsanulokensis]|uniref:DUF4349 domain-containing protein n=1 Tax=Planotetraspora phitsanulokensis TaxID=575192 RepID=A0A8J3XJA4_9ACTN|nr:DUF4349 domain-containing protein [Planotetraspora phitsanulokensis]GII38373.1 hypothetical protein Pph01_33760 [Planotetraspora phitsanulokensis]
MKRIRYGVALVAATVFLISGCGSGSESGMSSTADGAAAPAAPETVTGQAAAGGSGGSVGSSAGPGAPRADNAKIVTSDRSVVQTAELTVQAKNVMGAADNARQIVTSAGGYASDEKSTSQPGNDIAVVTFKVPPAQYTDVLARLGRDLGKRISQRQGTEDVTGEVADVASRVKSAESSLAQFRRLLSKATAIGEIMDIEREISSREADLESLQARQRALSERTGMATITLTVVLPPTPTQAARAAEPEGPSFLSGLEKGWETLVASTGVALAVLGALLPWLVVAAVIWVAVVAVMRLVRPNRKAAGAPAKGPGGQPPVPVMAGSPPTGTAAGAPSGPPTGPPAGPPHGGQPGGPQQGPPAGR